MGRLLLRDVLRWLTYAISSAAGKYGLLQLEGPEWRKHRKLLQPAFGPNQLRAAVPLVNRETHKLFAYWDELIAEGNSMINFHEHIVRCGENGQDLTRYPSE